MSSNPLPLSKALQQRLDANVELTTFYREAEDRIRLSPQDGFSGCSNLLEAACRKGAFTGLVNYELDRLLSDPNYALEASSDVDMLVLRSRFFNLTLRIVAQAAQTSRLIGLASDMIIAPLMAFGATMTRYREPAGPATKTLDRSGQLELVGDERVPFGQSIYFKAGQNVFVIQNSTELPSLVACLSSTVTLTTRWEYDIVTRQRLRVMAADHSVSRLQLLASVLAEMQDPRAVTALVVLMEHPAHYVRWAALQAVICLDREHGISLLKKATNDPHEHVRSAAVRSLAKLNIPDCVEMPAAQ